MWIDFGISIVDKCRALTKTLTSTNATPIDYISTNNFSIIYLFPFTLSTHLYKGIQISLRLVLLLSIQTTLFYQIFLFL